MKERLHWFAMHGFIRGAAALGAAAVTCTPG